MNICNVADLSSETEKSVIILSNVNIFFFFVLHHSKNPLEFGL